MGGEEDAVQFPSYLDEKLVDTEKSYRWLKYGDIKGQTGSTAVAAQQEVQQWQLNREYSIGSSTGSRAVAAQHQATSTNYF
jgi:hypothetical protein